MSEALISICIPAYNASKFIAETLESVKKQTYSQWELIVVEDGSLDGTKEIVEVFSKEVTQSVRYLLNEKNLGLTTTRNVAAKAARGEWIALLDSDDLWHESHLADLIKTSVNQPDCLLIHSGSILFDSESGKVLSERAPTNEDIEQFPISLFQMNYIIQPSSVMIAYKLFKATGGSNTEFRYAEDIEFWFRIAKKGYKFAFTGRNTCYYRKHAGAITTKVLELTVETARVYDENQDWETIPKKIKRRLASEAWLSAARLYKKNNKSLAVKYILKSLQYQITLKHLIHFALIQLSPTL